MSDSSPSTPTSRPGRIDWGRALTAGLVATIVMTVVMALMGTNIVKMLGSMIAGSGSAAMQYVAGGLIHFMIGIGYGLLYAAVIGPVVEWNRVLKGIVYGLAITAIALAAMPVMSAMMEGSAGSAQNPCATKAADTQNPCAAANPCAQNPCAAKNPCAPSNPCTAKAAAQTGNPCNPSGSAQNACHAAAGNPCNPCGGSGGGPWSGVLSVINHLVYALTLAFVYGRVR